MAKGPNKEDYSQNDLEFTARRLMNDLKGRRNQPVSEFMVEDINTYKYAIPGYVNETPPGIAVSFSYDEIDDQLIDMESSLLDAGIDADDLVEERKAELLDMGVDESLIDINELKNDILREKIIEDYLLEVSEREQESGSKMKLPVIAKVGDDFYMLGYDLKGNSKLTNLSNEVKLLKAEYDASFDDPIAAKEIREEISKTQDKILGLNMIDFPSGKNKLYISSIGAEAFNDAAQHFNAHTNQPQPKNINIAAFQPENVHNVLGRLKNGFDEGHRPPTSIMLADTREKNHDKAEEKYLKMSNQILDAGGTECRGFAVLAYAQLRKQFPEDVHIQMATTSGKVKHNFVIIGYDGEPGKDITVEEMRRQKDNIVIVDLWALAVGHNKTTFEGQEVKSGGVYTFDQYPLTDQFFKEGKIRIEFDSHPSIAVDAQKTTGSNMSNLMKTLSGDSNSALRTLRSAQQARSEQSAKPPERQGTKPDTQSITTPTNNEPQINDENKPKGPGM